MKTALHDLADLGQSPWLDGTGRDLTNCALADLVTQGVRGLLLSPATTTNENHRQRLLDTLRTTPDPKQAYLTLAATDACHACTTLEGTVPDPTPRDGWVSVELDPRIAHDVRSTVEEAHRLHQAVNHPRLYVKIPGTIQGLAAIEEATALGIRVDVTLLFSIYRHRQAAEAYLRGLRRLRDSGGSLRGMSSIASFPLSRLDTTADEALRAVGGNPTLTTHLATATAKIAYRTYKTVFTGMRWDELSAAGAHPQTCLWSATPPTDPTLPTLKYIEALIGPETITAIPHQTLEPFLTHGRVAPTLEDNPDEPDTILNAFRDAGIDYDTLTSHLEKTALRDASWTFTEMLNDLSTIRAEL